MKIILNIFFIVSLSFTGMGLGHTSESKDRTRWLQSELHLTKKQKKEIKKILDEYQEQIQDLRVKVEASKNELRKSFRSSEKGKKYNQVQ
jgi:hypothetical protein